MTREEAIDLAIDEHDCKYAEEFVDKIYNDHETQLKTKDEEIKRLKEKIYCLENDTIMLNMEQRLIDISLVLAGKLTSKGTK